MRQMRPVLQRHMDRLAESISEVRTLETLLVNRLGDKFKQELAEMEINIDKVDSELVHNEGLMDYMIAYLADMSCVAPVETLSKSKLETEVMQLEGFMGSLSGFVSAHRYLSEPGALDFPFSALGEVLSSYLTLPSFILSLMQQQGATLVDAHSGPIIQSLVECLSVYEVRLNLCEPAFLESHDKLEHLFGMVVMQPSVRSLASAVDAIGHITAELEDHVMLGVFPRRRPQGQHERGRPDLGGERDGLLHLGGPSEGLERTRCGPP